MAIPDDGAKSSGKGREQSQDPQVAPGQDIISALIAALTDRGLQRFEGPFGAPVGDAEAQFFQTMRDLNIQGSLGTGFQSLENIAGGSLQDAAAPGLSRLLDVGSANLNEQAALSGVLSSSGAAQNQADFSANAIAQLQQSLAPLQLSASQTLASPGTAGIAGGAFGGERQILDEQIQRMIQNFQQEQSLIPGLLSGAGVAAGGTSFFQPTTSAGKGENLLTAASPVLAQALSGYLKNRQTNNTGNTGVAGSGTGVTFPGGTSSAPPPGGVGSSGDSRGKKDSESGF